MILIFLQIRMPIMRALSSASMLVPTPKSKLKAISTRPLLSLKIPPPPASPGLPLLAPSVLSRKRLLHFFSSPLN